MGSSFIMQMIFTVSCMTVLLGLIELKAVYSTRTLEPRIGNSQSNSVSSVMKHWTAVRDEALYLYEQDSNSKGLSEEMNRRKLLLGILPDISLGLVGPSKAAGPTMASTNGSFYRWDSVVPPDAFDWRKFNVITPVKTQGHCASCWAIAAADSITMGWSISQGYGMKPFDPSKTNATGDPQFGAWGRPDSSAQEICDCGGTGSCCQGGWPEWAFSYVLANGGVSYWQTYPYMQTDSNCSASMKNTATSAKVTGWEMIPPRSVEAAKKQVYKKPYLALIAAGTSSFQNYMGGFFDGDCGDELNHVVVVVGYGTSADFGSYWIIKNSWGPIWGDNGYMYLAMKPGKGHCSIHAAPGLAPTYYPNVDADPCTYFPSPCGAGTCYSVVSDVILLPLPSKTIRVARCTCPPGYVEYRQTNPAKCVKADPCGRNPNPCGVGSCSNLADGSHSCSCPSGYFTGAGTDGSPTCVSGIDLKDGLSTVTAVVGTTLQAVANAYGTTVSNIVSLNPWTSSLSLLLPGSKLSISFEGRTSACSSSYISQSGESCVSLASKFGLSLSQLKALNPLVSCGLLGVLFLAPGTEICTKTSSLATSPGAATPPKCGKTYEVQPDDTCATVKLQAPGLSDSLFALLNPGLKCNAPLNPTMVLCTGQDTGSSGYPNCSKFYRIQHGDTCPSVWLGATMTQQQFYTLNPGIRCNSPYLQVGQKVCIDKQLLGNNTVTSIPYVVQPNDNLTKISEFYADRCKGLALPSSICSLNFLSNNCTLPPIASNLLIPCGNPVGRDCGCDDDYDPYFGSDGVWYQNYCQAVCNFALPATKTSNTCKRNCMYRAGLSPANDPNNVCNDPCPWPQWNPQPSNWWRVAKTFSDYYIGACRDWCYSTANTLSKYDKDNWSNYYNSCVSACRRGKC